MLPPPHYCSLSTVLWQTTLFEDYKTESQNKNEIAFELSLDNLLRGLKSGKTLLLSSSPNWHFKFTPCILW